MTIRNLITFIERFWYFIRIPLTLFIFLSIIHTFFFTIFIVDGASMDPTLRDGQLLIVNKISYLLKSPKKGEIVIMQFQGDPQKRIFVKRVIGEPFGSFNRQEKDSYGPVSNQNFVLGSGQYYVLGDNREVSGDSRLWGPVPRENILGQVL